MVVLGVVRFMLLYGEGEQICIPRPTSHSHSPLSPDLPEMMPDITASVSMSAVRLGRQRPSRPLKTWSWWFQTLAAQESQVFLRLVWASGSATEASPPKHALKNASPMYRLSPGDSRTNPEPLAVPLHYLIPSIRSWPRASCRHPPPGPPSLGEACGFVSLCTPTGQNAQLHVTVHRSLCRARCAWQCCRPRSSKGRPLTEQASPQVDRLGRRADRQVCACASMSARHIRLPGHPYFAPQLCPAGGVQSLRLHCYLFCLLLLLSIRSLQD